MFANRRSGLCLALSLGCAVVLSACHQPLSVTDRQMALMRDTRKVSYPAYAYMVDNAMLHDMSIADFHFVPHSDELSGTGAERLERMAYLLNTYGGTVRYETYSKDEDLIHDRLEHVKEYLTLVGCNMDRVKVTAQRSGGRTSPADEAIEIKERGTKPQDQAGAGGGFGSSFLGGR